MKYNTLKPIYYKNIEEFVKNIFFHRRDVLVKTSSTNRWHTKSNITLTKGELLKYYFSKHSFLACRFGKNTYYATIDIDKGSIYHPNQDPTAISFIIDVLKELGIEGVLTIRSSSSTGIHIIIPFPKLVESFQIAKLLKTTVEKHGLIIKSGQLEIFPNVKKDIKALYNGVRLPLQQGSYILDNEFNAITNNYKEFMNLWYEQTLKQDMNKLNNLLHLIKADNDISEFSEEDYNYAMFNALSDSGIDLTRLLWQQNKLDQDLRNVYSEYLVEKNDSEILGEIVSDTNFVKENLEKLYQLLSTLKGSLHTMCSELISLFEIGFTSKSQTNNISLHIARLAKILLFRENHGFTKWLTTAVISIPNYTEFSSHSPKELAVKFKSTIKNTCAKYVYFKDYKSKKQNTSANVKQLKSAKERIEDVVREVVISGVKFMYKSHFLNHIVKCANVSKQTVYEIKDNLCEIYNSQVGEFTNTSIVHEIHNNDVNVNVKCDDVSEIQDVVNSHDNHKYKTIVKGRSIENNFTFIKKVPMAVPVDIHPFHPLLGSKTSNNKHRKDGDFFVKINNIKYLKFMNNINNSCSLLFTINIKRLMLNLKSRILSLLNFKNTCNTLEIKYLNKIHVEKNSTCNIKLHVPTISNLNYFTFTPEFNSS